MIAVPINVIEFAEQVLEMADQIEDLKDQLALYEAKEGLIECPNCTCAMCERNRQTFAARTLH